MPLITILILLWAIASRNCSVKARIILNAQEDDDRVEIFILNNIENKIDSIDISIINLTSLKQSEMGVVFNLKEAIGCSAYSMEVLHNNQTVCKLEEMNQNKICMPPLKDLIDKTQEKITFILRIYCYSEKCNLILHASVMKILNMDSSKQQNIYFSFNLFFKDYMNEFVIRGFALVEFQKYNYEFNMYQIFSDYQSITVMADKGMCNHEINQQQQILQLLPDCAQTNSLFALIQFFTFPTNLIIYHINYYQVQANMEQLLTLELNYFSITNQCTMLINKTSIQVSEQHHYLLNYNESFQFELSITCDTNTSIFYNLILSQEQQEREIVLNFQNQPSFQFDSWISTQYGDVIYKAMMTNLCFLPLSENMRIIQLTYKISNEQYNSDQFTLESLLFDESKYIELKIHSHEQTCVLKAELSFIIFCEGFCIWQNTIQQKRSGFVLLKDFFNLKGVKKLNSDIKSVIILKPNSQSIIRLLLNRSKGLELSLQIDESLNKINNESTCLSFTGESLSQHFKDEKFFEFTFKSLSNLSFGVISLEIFDSLPENEFIQLQTFTSSSLMLSSSNVNLCNLVCYFYIDINEVQETLIRFKFWNLNTQKYFALLAEFDNYFYIFSLLDINEQALLSEQLFKNISNNRKRIFIYTTYNEDFYVEILQQVFNSKFAYFPYSYNLDSIILPVQQFDSISRRIVILQNSNCEVIVTEVNGKERAKVKTYNYQETNLEFIRKEETEFIQILFNCSTKYFEIIVYFGYKTFIDYEKATKINNSLQEQIYIFCWEEQQKNSYFFYPVEFEFFRINTYQELHQISSLPLCELSQTFEKKSEIKEMRKVLAQNDSICLFLKYFYTGQDTNNKEIELSTELRVEQINIFDAYSYYFIQLNGFNFVQITQEIPFRKLSINDQNIESIEKASFFIPYQKIKIQIEADNNEDYIIWKSSLVFSKFRLVNILIKTQYSINSHHTNDVFIISLQPQNYFEIIFNNIPCDFYYFFAPENPFFGKSISFHNEEQKKRINRIHETLKIEENNYLLMKSNCLNIGVFESFSIFQSPLIHYISSHFEQLLISPYASFIFNHTLNGKFLRLTAQMKDLYFIPCTEESFFDLKLKRQHHFTALRNDFGKNFMLLFIWPQMQLNLTQYWDERNNDVNQFLFINFIECDLVLYKKKKTKKSPYQCLWMENIVKNDTIIIEDREDVKIKLSLYEMQEITFNPSSQDSPNYKLLEIVNKSMNIYLVIQSFVEVSVNNFEFILRLFDEKENVIKAKYYNNRNLIQLQLKGSSFVEIESIFLSSSKINIMLTEGNINYVSDFAFNLQIPLNNKLFVRKLPNHLLQIFESDSFGASDQILFNQFEGGILITKKQMTVYQIRNVQTNEIFGYILEQSSRFSKFFISQMPCQEKEEVGQRQEDIQQVKCNDYRKDQLQQQSVQQAYSQSGEYIYHLSIAIQADLILKFNLNQYLNQKNQESINFKSNTQNYLKFFMMISHGIDNFLIGMSPSFIQMRGSNQEGIIINCELQMIEKKEENKFLLHLKLPFYNLNQTFPDEYARLYFQLDRFSLINPITDVFQLHILSLKKYSEETQHNQNMLILEQLMIAILIAILLTIRYIQSKKNLLQRFLHLD